MTRGRTTKQEWLIFVDTNILLDFYRVAGESAERQITALEQHKNSIICTDQVRMEFLKNRQKVIADKFQQFKKPEKISVPQIVTNYEQSKMLAKHLDNARKSHDLVQKKFEQVLKNPSQHDLVYQGLNRIFDHQGPFNLKRNDKEGFEIRNLARKRFALGYPPRKSTDTSIGDAVNWEWIVKCAQKSDQYHNVLLVSRDGDYGIIHGQESFLNDWLRREFKERVSQKRGVELTNRLTVALKRLAIPVTEEDEKEETKIVESHSEHRNFLLEALAKQDLDSDSHQIRRNFLAEIFSDTTEGASGKSS